MATKTCVLIILTFISLLSSPLSQSVHFNIPAVFNFGDSNSDTGGLISAGIERLDPPNGQNYFHNPSGRYCDGRLIIDFLSKFCSVNKYISLFFPCFLCFLAFYFILIFFLLNCEDKWCSGCNGTSVSKCLPGFDRHAEFSERVQFRSRGIYHTPSYCNIC